MSASGHAPGSVEGRFSPALTNNESLAPTSYPLGGGTLSLWASLAKYVLDAGIKHAAVLFTDIPSNRLGAEVLMAKPLKAGGANVTLVPVATDAADYTAVVRQANAGDPGVIILMVGPDACERVIQAAEQTGLTVRLGGMGAGLPHAGRARGSADVGQRPSAA